MVVEEGVQGDLRVAGGVHAMRAYLQRGETRLSTMQRIAGAFLSGAGLLVLLPFLLGDALGAVLSTSLASWENIALLGPYLVSVGLPIYALYELVKDLIKFYFTPVQHGDVENIELSKFALTGLAFPPDESPAVKERVLQLQGDNSIIAFAIGELEAESKPLSEVYSQAGIGLIDPIRQPFMDSSTGTLSLSPRARFHVAMAVTGSRDRTLIEETARMEASLLRHALILRRLVLRYGKALLLTIWTTMITMVVVAIVDGSGPDAVIDRHEAVQVALGTYILWGLLVPVLVRLPQRWSRATDRRATIRDPSLLRFERHATWSACLAVTFTTLALAADLLGIY